MPPRSSVTLLAGVVAIVGCRQSPTKSDAGIAKTSPPSFDAGLGDLLGQLGVGEDAGPAGGDHIHIETSGETKDAWMSGWASFPHSSHREYAFAGTLGCAGQRFSTKLTKHTRLDIGYTRHKAFVLVEEDPYVLDKAPVVDGKSLVWAGDFKNADTGHTRFFRLRIDCPLPAK